MDKCPACGYGAQSPYREATTDLVKVVKPSVLSRFGRKTKSILARLNSTALATIGKKAATVVVGIGGVVGIGVVGLLVLYAPYKLGMWLGNDMFHWNLADHNEKGNEPTNGFPFSGWGVGALTICSPLIVYGLYRLLNRFGNFIVSVVKGMKEDSY